MWGFTLGDGIAIGLIAVSVAAIIGSIIGYLAWRDS